MNMKTFLHQKSDQMEYDRDKVYKDRYLSFEKTLSHGTFSTKENEIIALAVSETFSSYAEQAVISADQKLSTLATLAKELTVNRGEAAQDAMDNFLSAGYNPRALDELVAKVAIRRVSTSLFGNIKFGEGFLTAA